MGLDVYMYEIENFERVKAKEKEYHKISEEIWKRLFGERKWNEVPDDEMLKFDAETEKIKKAMELNEYGSDLSRQRIEIDSSIHPEHMFKIGYFRSSYNGTGFNSIVRQSTGMTIYDVFAPIDDCYECAPDWIESKTRAQKLIEEIKRVERDAPYIAETLSSIKNTNVKIPESKTEALKMFLDEIKTHNGFLGSYTNAKGNFYLDKPIEVYGLMMGKNEFMKEECAYYISKMDYSWYIQAAEVMLETIEYVLSQDRPEWYVLAWSG